MRISYWSSAVSSSDLSRSSTACGATALGVQLRGDARTLCCDLHPQLLPTAVCACCAAGHTARADRISVLRVCIYALHTRGHGPVPHYVVGVKFGRVACRERVGQTV